MIIPGTYRTGNKPAEVVSVFDFGAKGDGVTDSSTAFALATISAGTETSILVPPGVYNVPTGDFSAYKFHSYGPVAISNNETIVVDQIGQRKSAITITVGAGGEYTTINDALKALDAYKMAYTEGGIEAQIILLTGFVMSEQVVVVQKDLSWITIRSEDATVTIDRSSLVHLSGLINIDLSGVGGVNQESRITNAACAFAAVRSASLPNIGVLFNMDNSGLPQGDPAFNLSGIGDDRHGILVAQNSKAFILPDSGVTNCAGRGLYLIESNVSARWAIFDNSSTIGFRAANNSSLDCRQGSATGCGEHGLALDGGNKVLARNGDFSGATDNCIDVVNGNILDVREVNASGSGARGANILSSSVDIDGANLSGANTQGLYASDASVVNADSLNATNAGAEGIRALGGAVVNAASATVTGAATNGVFASTGSRVNFSSGVADVTANNVRVGSGAIITATAATGSLSQTANIITNNGIIFQ